MVATSGDTGSAAIQAVRGLENIDIVVLLPHGRCTEIQELQMTTCIDDNVHVFAGRTRVAWCSGRYCGDANVVTCDVLGSSLLK